MLSNQAFSHHIGVFGQSSQTRNNNTRRWIPFWLLSHMLVAVAAYHVGFTVRMNLDQQCPRCDLYQPEYSNHKCGSSNEEMASSFLPTFNQSSPILPPTIRNVLAGVGRVRRDSFADMFDIGVPLMPSSEGNEEVIIFYSDESSFPINSSSWSANTNPMSDDPNIFPRLLRPEEATSQCLTMNMILIETERKNHCVVMMGQWPSYFVHKWMRTEEAHWASFQRPLKLVSRSRQRNRKLLDYPGNGGDLRYVEEGLASLQNYLQHMGQALEKLKPLAQTCTQNRTNEIIVMLCSHGQSELFLNFVCSARNRGLDTSQVLLFATDLKTKELAESVGITTFYDDKIFGNMMLAPSKRFGDVTFKRLMLAKVYCLHLISQLKYNILYQDSDLIWYQHPLEFFASPSIGDFDMYFQDDGSRSYRNEAYHANGGFFYIRNNKRTAYFLSNLVRQGDFILKKNEQIVINVLLNEHASLTGLRVKTMNRDETEFIGGWQFHGKPELMKRVMQGNVTPYVFHMSWTADKIEKLHFLEQMGYLFVSESCIGQKLSSACCIADPIARCHYKDKPSKIPCSESPVFGRENTSFW